MPSNPNPNRHLPENPRESREYFLKQLWFGINMAMEETWIDALIEKQSDESFADLGPALKRLLALGASRRDLSLICRFAGYTSAFGALYLIDESGIDPADVRGLHQSLLTADPSGLEGRPGSAPQKKIEVLPPEEELERTLSEAGIKVHVLDIYSSSSEVRLYGIPSQLEAARVYFAARNPPMSVITILGPKWEIFGSQPPEPDV